MELRYGIGGLDCFAGCVMQRWWTFHVAADGAVEYRGVEGSPFPTSPEEQGWGVCGLVGGGSA